MKCSKCHCEVIVNKDPFSGQELKNICINCFYKQQIERDKKREREDRYKAPKDWSGMISHGGGYV